MGLLGTTTGLPVSHFLSLKTVYQFSVNFVTFFKDPSLLIPFFEISFLRGSMSLIANSRPALA